MTDYEMVAMYELRKWQKKMMRKPSFFDKLSKRIQVKLNSYIPKKIHKVISDTIKQMVRGVLFGFKYTVAPKSRSRGLVLMEQAVQSKIEFYKTTAATEGGITGAGGFLMAMADFPLLLGIKLKMLFDIAAEYGFDTKDFKERLFILHVFQLAFSSQQHRGKVYQQIVNWEDKNRDLPEDIHQFDWMEFQLQYRDYIDLAKLAQLIPGVGAVVGVVVNYRLLTLLGTTAKNAYRMRLEEARLLK